MTLRDKEKRLFLMLPPPILAIGWALLLFFVVTVVAIEIKYGLDNRLLFQRKTKVKESETWI